MNACPCCGAFPILQWLREKGVRLKPGPSHLLRYTFENAGAYREVGELLDDAGVSDSTARAWMVKKSLPSPSAWLELARALHVGRSIYEHPWLSAHEIGTLNGYADRSGMSKLLARNFELCLPDLQARFEPAELVEAWWERSTRKQEVAV